MEREGNYFAILEKEALSAGGVSDAKSAYVSLTQNGLRNVAIQSGKTELVRLARIVFFSIISIWQCDLSKKKPCRFWR